MLVHRLSMKTPMLWGLGIIAYLLFSVWLLPASLWLKLVPTPNGVQFGAVTGTLWSGQIQAVRFQHWFIPDVRWQLQLSSLWRGQLGAQVQAGQIANETAPYLQLRLQAGFNYIRIEQSSLRLPMTGVMASVQLPMPVDASGVVVLNLQQFKTGQPYCDAATGTASWQQARFKAPTGWIDLNQIDGSLACANGHLSLQTNPDNPLGLAIKAELLADRYQVSGTLQPAASMPAEVHQAMRFVGQQQPDGRFPLNFSGRLQP